MSEDVTLDEFVEQEANTSESERDELARKTVCGVPPQDWNVARLGEVVRVVSGNSLPTKYQNGKKGEHPVYKVSDMNATGNQKYVSNCSNSLSKKDLEELNHTLYPKGTTILPKVGAALLTNKRRMLTEPSSFDNNVMGWVPDTINPEFLYYVSCMIDMEAVAQKGAVPSISKAIAKSLKVPSPPHSEQHKVATVLHTVDQAIQKTEEVIKQTQQVKEGTIEQLTTRGVGHSKYKNLDISPKFLEVESPKTWEKVSYEEVSENITYGFTNPMPEADNGPWMITAKDIKGGKINYNTARKTTQKAFSNKLTEKSRPKIGTVLITKDGTLGNVGIVDRENICINQSVASIEPIREMIVPKFLALVLQSSFTKKLIESYNPQTTIGHIKITELAKWEFGLPPIEEQRKIVSIVDSIQKTLDSERTRKDHLQNIKEGLMQDLLSGTVRTDDTNMQVLDEVAQYG